MCALGSCGGKLLGVVFFFCRVSTVLFLTCSFVNGVTFKQLLVEKQTAFPEGR